MSDAHRSNLLEPPATRLPDDPAATLLAAGSSAYEAAARHPQSSLAWAVLAEQGLLVAVGEPTRAVAAYAFARTGYHRGLDALRRAGWKGAGPIPWGHEPNRGFLRALGALARAAETLGEADEAARCRKFLRDSSAEAADALGV